MASVWAKDGKTMVFSFLHFADGQRGGPGTADQPVPEEADCAGDGQRGEPPIGRTGGAESLGKAVHCCVAGRNPLLVTLLRSGLGQIQIGIGHPCGRFVTTSGTNCPTRAAAAATSQFLDRQRMKMRKTNENTNLFLFFTFFFIFFSKEMFSSL